MKVSLIILLVCSIFKQVLCNDSAPPRDVVHIFDRSGSVSPEEWQEFIRIAKNVTETIGNVIGYSEEVGSLGLRVSLISFACQDSLLDDKTTQVHLDRSGNHESVLNAFDELSKIGPIKTGKTCLRLAAAKTIESANARRVLAAVVYSDGMIQDINNVQNFGNDLKSVNGALYAVGVGKDTDVEKLGELTGNESNVFQWLNRNTMKRLASAIQSQTAQIVNLIDVIAVFPDGTPVNESVCIEELVTMEFTGINLQGNLSYLCEFTENGVLLQSTPVVTKGSLAFACNYSANNIESNTLVVRIVGFSQQGVRSTIGTLALEFMRKFCFGFTISDSSSRIFLPLGNKTFDVDVCLGTNETVSFQGEMSNSYQYLNSISNSTISCILSQDNFVISSAPLYLLDEVFQCSFSWSDFDYVGNLLVGLAIDEDMKDRRFGLSSVTASLNRTDSFCLTTEIDHASPILCAGEDFTLLISGKTVEASYESQFSVLCLFNGYEAIVAESIDGSKFLKCRIPLNLRLLNGTVSFRLLVDGSMIQRDLEILTIPCVDIMKPTEEHACAGDEFNVSFSGKTIQALLSTPEANDFSCDFGIRQVSAVLDDETVQIVCEVPKWAPWTVNQREIINISSVSLRLNNMWTITSLLPPLGICMDVSSHGFTDIRRLMKTAAQPPCFPWCCKRAGVTIEFAGRTVEILQERPELVRCTFTRVADMSLVSSNVTFPKDNTIACDEVEGWEPGTAKGDYNKVAVEIFDEDLGVFQFVVVSQDYKPSSASFNCIEAEFQPFTCLGADENLAMLKGITIQAILSYASRTNVGVENITACQNPQGIISSTMLAREGVIECPFSLESTTLGHQVNVSLGLLIDDTNDPPQFDLSSINAKVCVNSIRGEVNCPTNSTFDYKAVFRLENNADPRLFRCLLKNSNNISAILIPDLIDDGRTIDCSLSEIPILYTIVDLVFIGSNTTVLTEELHVNSSCSLVFGASNVPTSTPISSSPTTGKSSDDSTGTLSPGIIALIVILVILFVLLCVICIVCVLTNGRKHQKQKEHEEPLVDEGTKADGRENPEQGNHEPEVVAGGRPISKCIQNGDEQEDVATPENAENEEPVLAQPRFKIGDNVKIIGDNGRVSEIISGKITNVNNAEMVYEVTSANGEVKCNIPESAMALNDQSKSKYDYVRPEVLLDDGSGFKYPLKKPIQFRELPANQFELIVNKTGGLGIKLGITQESKGSPARLIISEFVDIPSGGWGPVEGSGRVGISDELLMINGVPVDKLSLREVEKLIRESPNEIRFKFGRNHEEPFTLHASLSKS